MLKLLLLFCGNEWTSLGLVNNCHPTLWFELIILIVTKTIVRKNWKQEWNLWQKLFTTVHCMRDIKKCWLPLFFFFHHQHIVTCCFFAKLIIIIIIFIPNFMFWQDISLYQKGRVKSSLFYGWCVVVISLFASVFHRGERGKISHFSNSFFIFEWSRPTHFQIVFHCTLRSVLNNWS